MTNETKCSVVRDLLPAYIEKLTSQETTAFVNEHLAECEACRAACRAMTGTQTRHECQQAALVKRLKKRNQKRRNCVVGLAVLLALALAVCLLPWPHHIDSTFDALEWRLGDTDYEGLRRTVTIDGVYRDYLFRTDYFEGTFSIEGYPETQLEQTRWYAEDGMIPLMSYFDPQNGLLKSVGILLIDPAKTMFSVLVMESATQLNPKTGEVEAIEGRCWNGENGLVISWPGGERAQALDTLKALAEKLSPDWLGASNLR